MNRLTALRSNRAGAKTKAPMHQRTSSDPAVVVPVVIRKKRMVWNIFGAAYDLTPFLDVHPGGRRILETVEPPSK